MKQRKGLISSNKKDITVNTSSGLPAQKLKFSQKNKEWKERCVKAIIDNIVDTGGGLDGDVSNNNLNKMLINYNLMRGKINLADYTKYTDPFNLNGQYGGDPATFQHYSKIYPKINWLTSVERTMPFEFKAYCVAGGGVNDKNEYKKRMILNNVKSLIEQEMLEQGVITEEEIINQEVPLPQVEEYMRYDYQDIREEFVNLLLEDLQYKLDLKNKFNKGFKHGNISAHEIYYIGIVNGLPVFRVVNPLYFRYAKTIELENIEDSQYCLEVTYMGPGEILDEFSEYLSDEHIDRIERNMDNASSDWKQAASLGYNPSSLDPRGTGLLGQPHSDGTPVYRATWKSMRLIQFIKYIDENGDIQETVIDDDSYSIPKEMKPYILEHTQEWITDVWEGVQILGDIYPYIRPLANQINGKLPYIGSIYNSLNGDPVATIDFLKPLNYKIDVLMHKMESEIIKSDGKKFIMDLAQIPKSQGWDPKQWMYYFKNVGVAWINSSEEGHDPLSQQIHKFNQMTSVDMQMSQIVGQYIMAIEKLEAMMDEIVGISRQAQGQIMASETATGVNRAITQTTEVTRPLFMVHNDIKRRCLEYLKEVAKLCVANGKYTVNFMNDGIKKFMEMDVDKFQDSDYAIYITDSLKEQEAFEALKQNALGFVQNQQMSATELIEVFNNSSLSQLKNKIKEAEERRDQRVQQEIEGNQQALEAQRQLEERRYQDELKFKYDEMANKSLEAQLDREASLQEASIKAMGFGKDQDINNNGIPDIAEQTRLALETSQQSFEQQAKLIDAKQKQSDIEAKNYLERNKLSLQKEQMKQDKELKEKELKLKEKDIETKLKIAKSNKNKYDSNKKK